MTDDNEWRDCQKTEVVKAKGPYTEPDVINTMEGQYEVDEEYIEEHGGYYLMKGVDEEIYPCAKDTFEDSYEWVDHHLGTTDGDEYEEGELAEAIFFFVQAISLVKKTIECVEDGSDLNDEDKAALKELNEIINGIKEGGDDDGDGGNNFKVDDELY